MNAMGPFTVERVVSDHDLAECFKIRITVFVEEQKVPEELEVDEHDRTAIHYIGRLNGRPIATARVLEYHGAAKIGRVALLSEYRGQGYGYELMEYIHSEMPGLGYNRSLLDAQTYALGFYEKLGYVSEGDEFLDAGIPHFRMVREL